MRIGFADGVSLSRLLFLAPWVWLYGAGSGWALAVMAAIVATDVADGPLARRLRTAGPRGRLLDAGCDAAVVVVAALVVGLKDTRFLLLSGIAVACFASWGACSIRDGFACYTRLGRYDGAACYVLILLVSAGPLFPAGLGLRRMAGWLAVSGVGLLLAVSTVENLAALGHVPSGATASAAGSRKRED